MEYDRFPRNDCAVEHGSVGNRPRFQAHHGSVLLGDALDNMTWSEIFAQRTGGKDGGI